METREIGYISKVHGLKGQIILRVNEDLDIDSEKIKSLFLNINNSQVPYFVEECRPNNVGYIIKLEGITSVDESKKMVAKKVFVLTDIVIENENSLNEFIGYQVIDKEKGNLGVITYIDDKTDNVVAQINHPSGKEIMLPFNDDLIEEIDDDARTISFNAPQGLIDMYLNN